jgi:hypothetical protein
VSKELSARSTHLGAAAIAFMSIGLEINANLGYILRGLCRGDGMVDIGDLKSPGRDTVWVQFPPAVPSKHHQLGYFRLTGPDRLRLRTNSTFPCLPPVHRNYRQLMMF